MTRVQKVFCVFLCLCFLVVLAVKPEPFSLWKIIENVYRQFPLYYFIEEKTQETWGSIGVYYTVKRGDTLAGISKNMYQSYNYIEMIAEANGIDNVDEIYPGQILEIPQIED